MFSKLLLSALLASVMGLQASASPAAPPPRRSEGRALRPGEWHIPEGHQEMSKLPIEQIYPPHLRKRAGDHKKLDLKHDTTMVFKMGKKSHKAKRADTSGDPKKAKPVKKPAFENFYASVKAEPYALDRTKHRIIQFDEFKDLIKGKKPDLSKLSDYKVTLEFTDLAAKTYAENAWKVAHTDAKDFFYLIVDIMEGDIARALPLQIQSVETKEKSTVATLEAYPMAWDVIGDLDIKVYTDKGKKAQPQSINKRLDFNPQTSIPLGWNEDLETKHLWWNPLHGVIAKADVENQWKIDCVGCHTTGHLDLEAHFRTSWWWITEASISADLNFHAAIDIQAWVKLESKLAEDKMDSETFNIRDMVGLPDRSKPLEFEWPLIVAPITPLTIFGLINVGPEIGVSIVNNIKIAGEFTWGFQFNATLNTAFHMDFVNLGAFDPSTLHGPSVAAVPYLKAANVKATGGVALVTSIKAGVDVLRSGLESNVEALAPKFEFNVAAGYHNQGFCENNTKMRKQAKRDLPTLDGGITAQDTNSNGRLLGHSHAAPALLKDIKVPDSAKDPKNFGFYFGPELGLQLRFAALTGKGVLKELIPTVGTFKPNWLNWMWPLGGNMCRTINDFIEDPTKDGLATGNDSKEKKEPVIKFKQSINKEGERVKGWNQRPQTEEEKKRLRIRNEAEIIQAQQNAFWKFYERLVLGGVTPRITFTEPETAKDEIYFILENTKKGVPVLGKEMTIKKPLKDFPILTGCKLVIKDRSGNDVNFLGCLSDNPFIKSKTGCWNVPDAKKFLEVIKSAKPTATTDLQLCQLGSVYQNTTWT
ncbi:hypothetical protein TWF694_004569 [Orbilia ellipsospora]|uniref:DUF7223 domain-containing protein n=1 Tax=Orbilia ellipsospora TaxID=2528407 RepID=A0AAV9WVI9_9PEZI